MNVDLFFLVLVFWWGACIGSFLNVCIYRIPLELSVVRPRSHCPHCNHLIAWYDNIPLVSFLALRARCRHCGGPISPRYALVELLTAALFVLIWLRYVASTPIPAPGSVLAAGVGLTFAYWLVASGLILGSFVDFEHMIIPDRVTLGGIVAGLLLSAVLPVLHGVSSAWESIMASAIGAAVGFGLLWTVAGIGKLAFKKDAMGFGDVKLMGAVGAFLGWQAVLFTIMLSSLAGSLVGVALVLAGQKKMQSRIPYGPYLSLAALIWILWGAGWWDAYTAWLAGSVGR